MPGIYVNREKVNNAISINVSTIVDIDFMICDTVET
jgi:hypothetical protein